MKTFWKKISMALSLTTELTPAESLKCIVDDNKHDRLLSDIRSIRTKGDYIPNYNKPKKYTDYRLKRNVWELVKFQLCYIEQVEVSANVITSCERAEDFGGDVEKWLKTIHSSYTKEVAEKKDKAEATQKFWEEKQENVNKFMRHFTQVY